MAAAVIEATAALASGCGDTTGPDDHLPPAPPPYPVLTTPQNTLEAMRLAYERRDSVETAKVYDNAYQGESQDLSDPSSPPPAYFSKYDEIRHVGALAKTPTISDVNLDLGPSSSWTRLQSDDVTHPDWAVIQIGYHNIEIFDGSMLYQANGSNLFAFKFAPTEDSTSTTDTLWQVVRWVEIH